MFGARLAGERRRLRLSQQQVADVLAVSRSLVAAIETDRAPVDLERLLVLGGHGFDLLKVLTDESAPEAAGRLLDWSLAAKVFQRVDRWCESRGLPLPAEKRSILVKQLYLQLAARGHFDEAAVEEMLQLAA